jgi:hypothetical protein
VREDVGGDGGREQAWAGVSGLETAAKAGGGDLFVEGGEEVDTGALCGGEVERRDLGLAERKVGPADDDPLGHREQSIGRTPAAESEKAVGTGEEEEGCGGKLAGERGERIYGVVWGAVGAWSVEGGDGKVGAGCRWFGGAGEAGHGEAVGEAGDGGRGFEGLLAYGSEEDTVEREGVCRGGGQAQMAAMDGVECATEEGYAHSVMLEHFHYGGMGSGVSEQARRDGTWSAINTPPLQDSVLKG